tara:strand:- start:1366 stop:1683 length:318 start_codon:yes stop_codon:yes gene_type:complete
MYFHISKTCIKSIITKTHAILCSNEIPSPIVMVVSNAFLNICPLTNHAYNEIIRNINNIELSVDAIDKVIRLVKRAIRAWIPSVPELTCKNLDEYFEFVLLFLSL